MSMSATSYAAAVPSHGPRDCGWSPRLPYGHCHIYASISMPVPPPLVCPYTSHGGLPGGLLLRRPPHPRRPLDGGPFSHMVGPIVYTRPRLLVRVSY